MTSPSGRPPRMLVVTTVHQTLRAFLLPFADRLREQGWTVEAATRPHAEVAEVAPHYDAVHPVPWGRELVAAGNARALLVVRRLLRHGRYDVVHVHTPIASFVTRLAVGSLPRRRRPAVVCTAHGFHFYEGGSPRRNLVFRTAERLAGRWTDRLVVINDEDEQAVRRRRIVPPDRLRHLPGIGVDLEHYAPTPELLAEAGRLRDDLGLDGTTTVYVMVAELVPRKNHRAAVAALARLPDRSAVLLLAGTGPLEEAVDAQAAELGVADRVRRLGMVRDPRPLLLASDALVLPSRQEGLCRAVLEALSLGVPVVGARTRGIRELVDPDTGFLVDPDDVDGLARAMTEVLAMPSHGGLRARTRERMERYSLDHVLALHDELYAELLRSRAGGAVSSPG